MPANLDALHAMAEMLESQPGESPSRAAARIREAIADLKGLREAAGPAPEPDAIHGWFSLSYASWLIVPRLVMQSMPAAWQAKMVALLDEMDDTFDWAEGGVEYHVMARDAAERDGDSEATPFHSPDPALCDYRRGNIEHLRIKKKEPTDGR